MNVNRWNHQQHLDGPVNVMEDEESDKDDLRRQLERELSQDSRRLEANGWYHGSIPRSHAESLVLSDGEFLIRDSSSGKAGDVVLSVYWRTHLHFIISKVIVQPHTVYESIQYRLEDEPFESVSDLVTCYVTSNKSVTMATGAKITTPINRTHPLCVYATFRPCRQLDSSTGNLYSGGKAGSVSKFNNTIDYSTQSLPRPLQDRCRLRRRPSDPSFHREESPASPLKPSRVPSVVYPWPEETVPHHSGQDQCPETVEDGIPVLPARPLTLPRLRKTSKGDPRPLTETQNSFLNRRSCDLEAEASFHHHPVEREPATEDETHPQGSISCHFPTFFQLESFQTTLLPVTDVKPLDMKTLESVMLLFEQHSIKSMALHMLYSDLDVLGGLTDVENAYFNYRNYYLDRGVSSGIELCTLPNGQQLRSDLMERTQCMRLFVAVTILIGSSVEERTAMLNCWIEIAIESKTALGNMYGFAGLLLGLCMPQIQRLSATWNLLRQKHTQTAYTFEARLRPLIKLMSEGNNPHAPNTTIPDLHSVILLWEASLDAFLDKGVSIPRLNFHLGTTGPDYGLDLFSNHLNLIRSWSQNLPTYLRNSRTVLTGFQPDVVMLDMFRTEFQLVFMWGSQGVATDIAQRYCKFEQVLHAFSEQWEPSLVERERR